LTVGTGNITRQAATAGMVGAHAGIATRVSREPNPPPYKPANPA
jgi:hypothetical protein